MPSGAIPVEQLETIIDNTTVKPEHRAVFLGTAGKLMLAVVIGGAFVAVMMPGLGHRASFGISPERVRKMQMERSSDAEDANDPNEAEPTSEASEGDQGN
ncbi:MAG: hypothetical protein AMJ65_12865 [Phycisphaerae bacterium SG8_4]|nr:MAG: hypothetical protein AMJ65_12865 [Phycisphaerae bacterium SG8_4]